MNTQSNIVEVGRALIDSLNAHDLSHWQALLADNYTGSYPSMRNNVDRQVAAGYNAIFLTAVPDLHFEIQRTIAH